MPKRLLHCLAVILSIMFILSSVPWVAYATETDVPMRDISDDVSDSTELTDAIISEFDVTPSEQTGCDSTLPADTTSGEADDTLLTQIRTEIANFASYYDLTSDMSDEELASVYFNASEDPMIWANNICNQMLELSEAEIAALDTESSAILFFRFCAVVDCINTPVLVATTVTPVTGLSVTDTSGTGSVSGTTATVTVTGKSATNSITITNTSGSTKKVSFLYTVSYSTLFLSGSHTFGDNVSGTITATLASNGTLNYSITSPNMRNSTTTVVISDISLEDVATTVAVTVDYNSAAGTVKDASGTAITAGNTIDVKTNTGETLTAFPATGSIFLGWIDANGNLLSSETSYAILASEATTITVAFAHPDTDAWFKASGTYWTDDLQAAVDYASGKSDTSVILMASGTLPTGKAYTITSGVRLLIPYSASDDGEFTKEPSIQLSGTIQDYPPDAFRTLTIPSSTTITCSGSINVNGQRSGNGQPFCGTILGDYGKIILGGESQTFSDPEESDLTSQLIIENGGTLYCYGYITGSGMVEVKNGGTVHELLQLGDWPGGSNGTGWSEGTSKQFLLSQYYVQNIEAPMKLNYGAVENLEGVITASSIELKVSSAFVGTGSGLFQMTNANSYLLRIYDQAQDRMNYHLLGGSFTFGSIALYKNLFITKIDIDSANSILPITNNLSIYVEPGATLNTGNRAAVLPGAELVIKNGGTVNLASELFVYDVEDWNGIKDGAMSGYFHRVQQSISQGWAPADVNTSPKTNPLPYVATLNSISPRATGYYYYPSDKSQPMTNPKPITDSGKLEVNGTLNINTGGYVYASSGGTSADKVITGTGTIVHNGSLATAEKSITVGTSDYETTVKFNNALGNLAGVGEMQPFTNGGAIYHGLGEDYDNYWYQWKVSATASGDTTTGATVTGTSDPAIGAKSVGSNALVGYIANSSTSNGTFEFNVTPPNGYTLDRVTASNGTVSGTGPYTLTGVTADTTLTLTLTKVATGATYSVTIAWSQTSTATYTEGQTVYAWNTSDLKYTANTTAGGWNNTTSVVEITIDNTGSTGGVEADFGYTATVGGSASWSGLTDSKLSVAAAGHGTATLTVTPTGTPSAPATGTDITLGTITITLTKEES